MYIVIYNVIISNSVRYYKGVGDKMNYEQIAEDIFVELKNNTQTSLEEILGDFNKGEIGVLSYLAFDEDGVTSGMLSEKLGVTTPRMASILNSLEAKGYINRNTDVSDKRKSLVTITKKGMILAKDVKDNLIDKIISVIKCIDYNDIKEYIRINKEIKNILNKKK